MPPSFRRKVAECSQCGDDCINMGHGIWYCEWCKQYHSEIQGEKLVRFIEVGVK